MSDMRVVMTLQGGDETQRAVHLAAGVDAIVEPKDLVSASAGWVLPAQAGESWE